MCFLNVDQGYWLLFAIEIIPKLLKSDPELMLVEVFIELRQYVVEISL